MHILHLVYCHRWMKSLYQGQRVQCQPSSIPCCVKATSLMQVFRRYKFNLTLVLAISWVISNYRKKKLYCRLKLIETLWNSCFTRRKFCSCVPPSILYTDTFTSMSKTLPVDLLRENCLQSFSAAQTLKWKRSCASWTEASVSRSLLSSFIMEASQ